MARDSTPIRNTLTETLVQYGRVLDVDVDNYTVSVSTEFGKKPFTGIAFATPYQHFANGEGIYFMPEVGSVCWICEPSDGGRPFVLAWASTQVKGDHTANKMQLNPGDIYLGTRDENFMILRRGGVVQIGGGPLSQRIYMPIKNTIRDLCENYSLNTIGGNLIWSVGRTEETTDGKAPTMLIVEARQYANDKNPVATLTVGSHGSESDPIIRLAVKAAADDNADVNISMTMTKTGKVMWDVKDDFVYSGKGAYTVSVEKEFTVSSSKDMLLESKTNSNFKSGQEMKIEGGSTVLIKGATSATVDAPQIKLGGDAATHGVVWEEVLSLISSHVHIATAPGAPTSPSPQLSAITSMKSTVVKVS